MSRERKQSSEAMETESTSFNASEIVDRDFGEKSFILSSDSNAQQIHEENVRQLRQMNEKDLQDQRQQLMESMSIHIFHESFTIKKHL